MACSHHMACTHHALSPCSHRELSPSSRSEAGIVAVIRADPGVMSASTGSEGAVSLGSPSRSPRSPGREVWIPQIAHRQSASFAGLPPDDDTIHEEEGAASNCHERLSQSCEQLSGAQARQVSSRIKRRCPTPPRVLSPSLENVMCEVIADI